MRDLHQQAVLISGSSGTGGVGVGVVEAVLEAGGTPILNDRSEQTLNEALARFPQAGGVVGDVSVPQDVERMMEEATARYGVVHHLVNNAGVGLVRRLHECDEADFDHLYNINVRGVWLMTRAWLRRRLPEGGAPVEGPAAVVNISSVHATQTVAGYGLYASTKAAIEGMTRGLAVDYGMLGVRCNAVAPGYVHAGPGPVLATDTPRAPAGWVEKHTRECQALPWPVAPADVGRVVVFLLSQAAATVTGQNVTVDAGLMSMLYLRDYVSCP